MFLRRGVAGPRSRSSPGLSARSCSPHATRGFTRVSPAPSAELPPRSGPRRLAEVCEDRTQVSPLPVLGAPVADSAEPHTAGPTRAGPASGAREGRAVRGEQACHCRRAAGGAERPRRRETLREPSGRGRDPHALGVPAGLRGGPDPLCPAPSRARLTRRFPGVRLCPGRRAVQPDCGSAWGPRAAPRAAGGQHCGQCAVPRTFPSHPRGCLQLSGPRPQRRGRPVCGPRTPAGG